MQHGLQRGAVPTWDGQGWRPIAWAGAMLTRSAAQTLTQNVEAAVSYDVLFWDVRGPYTDLAKQPTRITIPAGRDGFYHVGCHVNINTGGTGIITRLRLRLNGTDEIAYNEDATFTSEFPSLQADVVWKFAAGDYIESLVTQDAQSSKALNRQSNRSPNFWLYRVGLGV